VNERRAYLRLVPLGALIATPAALLAAGFLALVHELEHVLCDDLPDALGHSSPRMYLVVGLPVPGPDSAGRGVRGRGGLLTRAAPDPATRPEPVTPATR
jgi:hypothetical protein